MFRISPAGAALGAAMIFASGVANSTDVTDTADIQSIMVISQRLDEGRSHIQTQTGASTYTLDAEAIATLPAGANTPFNQVVLQMPEVAQDSFGQYHIRGEHNGVQYRLNGIILPEGISVFGQSQDARFVSSVSLITGALPAEFGLRTAGILDITTKNGLESPGGSVAIYGGSHSSVEPSFTYGGGGGSFSYFVTGDFLRNNLGIESPDGSSNPLHDHTTQIHGFGYFENIIDSSNRLSLILGISDDEFQIPNQQGLQPTLGLNVNGQTAFLSNNLDETQHELAEYAIVSWQHSEGALNWQTSLSARYTSLHFEPDWVGDLLYNGIAQDAFKDDTAIGWQTDAAYKLGDAHTVRAGIYYQHDSAVSNTTSQVLPIDAAGAQT